MKLFQLISRGGQLTEWSAAQLKQSAELEAGMLKGWLFSWTDRCQIKGVAIE